MADGHVVHNLPVLGLAHFQMTLQVMISFVQSQDCIIIIIGPWLCQAFSDYQMQQMTSNFIEQFGFNDEEFADQDDVVE